MRVPSELTRPYKKQNKTKTRHLGCYCLVSCIVSRWQWNVQPQNDPISVVTGVDKTKRTAWEWPDMRCDWFGQDKTYSLRMTRYEWWLVCSRQNVKPDNDPIWVSSGDWFGQDKTYSLRMTRYEWRLVCTKHRVRNKHSDGGDQVMLNVLWCQLTY